MGALEVFTIGGGEFIVNVLNAVAAWCVSVAGRPPCYWARLFW